MDLGAYAQIPSLDYIAVANGIEVPRLRGYRLMAKESPLTEDELEKASKEVHDAVFNLLKEDEDSILVTLGLCRPDYAEWEAECAYERTREQYEAWNRYAGREDVMMIHARIGGGNWEGYGGSDLEREPWFLEKVDDGFDETYCDIYAKVDLNAKIKGENNE